MATPLATAFVRIRPDTSGFGRELQGDLSKSGKTFQTAGKKQGGLFRKGFASSLALGGGLAAAAGLIGFGKSSVQEFGKAQKAQNQLSDAFARFPKLADISKSSLQTYNTELAKKTRFDDDSIASGQAIIAQFGLTGKQVKGVTPLIADYAAKTGKDFPTAAKLLGKASLGNTRALKDLGINYKATGDKQKDMAAITKILRERVGGFAEKEGKTAAGQAEILKNQFGEIQETVGSKLVPVLKTLAGILLKVIDFVSRNSAVIGPLVAVIASIVAVIKIWTIAQRILNIVLATNPIVLIVAALAGLVIGLIIAYKKSETFRKIVDASFRAVRDIAVAVFDVVLGAIKAVWAWIKKNWPLLLAILTGPFGLAVIAITKNWDTIVGIVKGGFKAIGDAAKKVWENVLKPVFRFIINAWLTVAGAIINGAAKAFGWVPGLGGKLKTAARKFNNFRDDVNKALGGIDDEKVSVITGIKLPKGVSVHEVFGKPRTRGAFASGGMIPGSPSGTDNRIIGAATGEFVVNAAQTRRWLPMLNAINSGFAAGGLITSTAFPGRRQIGPFANYIQRGLNTTGGTIGAWLRASANNALGALLGGGLGAGATGGNATIVRNLAASLYGWVGAQWLALSALLTRESGFRNTAQNPTSTAYGLFQFLDGTWGSVGGHKTSDPRLQSIYGLRYIAGRYGSPAGAWAHSQATGWYDRGGWLMPGATLAINKTGRPERVLSPSESVGGNSYHITVNVPPNANQHEIGRQIVQSIKTYERGTGSGWRR